MYRTKIVAERRFCFVHAASGAVDHFRRDRYPVELCPQGGSFFTQVESSNEVDAPTDESPVADADNSVNDEAWKTEFEKSLLENYDVTPDHYEDLGNGVYQVYVEIDDKVVPYVAVGSATGDYHG